MKQLIFITAIILSLTACSTLTSDGARQLAVQYATIRTIDQSANIDARGVIETTRQLRAIIKSDQTIDLRGLARQIDTSQLSPYDQLLVSVLSEQIYHALRDYAGDVDLPVMERVLIVLNWVDEAALMAGGE